jgi:hypothetical protein
MHIAKVTFRHRNDFHFIAACRHCEKTSKWGDGYADSFYQQKVFPARHCPHCGLNEAGEKSAAAA